MHRLRTTFDRIGTALLTGLLALVLVAALAGVFGWIVGFSSLWRVPSGLAALE